MLLRKLLLEDEVVGDVVSVDHMESVGWWHFAYSYVRYAKSWKYYPLDKYIDSVSQGKLA